MCCAARTETTLCETVRDIVAAGGEGIAVPTDVTQLTAVRQMVKVTVETFGGLDIMVINAGVDADRQHVEDSDPEAWRTTPIIVRRPRFQPSNSEVQGSSLL